MSMLLVYTPKITSRIRYIFKHIFFRMLELDFKITSSVEDFVAHNGPKFSYSTKPLGKELFFYSSELLIDQGIHNILIEILCIKKYPIFFKISQKSAMQFDVFAASFYLISRYEEYLPHLKDSKGRFNFKQSTAFKNNFLDKPIVDLWIFDFREVLKNKFDSLIKKPSIKKKIVPILEVSSPYMFLHKSFLFSLFQFLNELWNLNFKMILNQIYVLLRISKDPYLEYDFLIDKFKSNKYDLISFFRYSQNSFEVGAVSFFNSSYRLLIKNISDKIPVSLLVSFFAQKNLKTIKNEMNSLRNLIHRGSQKTRLNFGLLSLSETYPILVQNEVLEDYSMGYVDAIGYRASTSIPFYYYDLMNEVQTPLKIFPVAITENVLRKFSSENAFNLVDKYYLALPLENSIFGFAFTPQMLSKTNENLSWRSSFLKYISKNEV